MIKKIIIKVCIVVFVFVAYNFLNRNSIEMNAEVINEFNVNISEPLVLDFENARIKLNSWDNDYVKVNPDDSLIEQKRQYSITNNENLIKCENLSKKVEEKGFVSFFKKINLKKLFKESDIYDFEINVPKDISVLVKGDLIKADGCKIFSISGNNVRVIKCNMLLNSISEGEKFSIRESNIGEGSILKNENIEIRDCKIDNIKISTDNIEKIFKGEVRDTTGKGITFDAEEFKEVDFLIRHSKIDRFTINGEEKKNGKIKFYKCEIKKYENNSKFNISK